MQTRSAPGLPVELTTFVGRATELAELERLVATARLLTLTGAGGSGKTRLAVELVERPSVAALGVTWVELASVAEPELLAQQVAEAAGVRDEVRDAATLVGLLRSRCGLLVLDNCEHLVEACAELAHELLRVAPALRILATSREALGVKGERAWLVPPLTLPGSEAAVQEVGSSEAVRLFVERARDAVPDFTLTPENAAAVAEICRRLDGIPLAIELAAARVRVLPPAQMRTRLDDVFRLLTGGGRTAMPRHRTLRATMDWSHDLLPGPARTLLRRMAVFRGGFTLEAVEEVCAGEGIDGDEVLDLLAGLVDRSLVVVRDLGCTARYGLLETVRQYAFERLSEAGEAERVQARHAAHLLRLVLEAATHAHTRQRRAAFDGLLPEMENIREALAWTRRHDPGAHVRMAASLGWFWFSVGHWTEARQWMEGAMTLPEAREPGPDRAALLFACGALAALQAQPATARPWLEEAAALAAAAGDRPLEAYALNYIGMTYAQEGSTEARAFSRRAEAWFRESGDDYGLRLALLLLALTAQFEGDAAGAIRLNEEAVEVARRFGQDRELSIALQNLAIVHLFRGDVERAEPLVLESLAAARRDPSIFFISGAVETFGEVRLRQGRVREAGRILGAGEAMRGLIGARPFRTNQQRLAPFLEAVRSGPEAAAFDAAWRSGAALSVEGVLDEILRARPDGGPGDDPALRARPPRAEPAVAERAVDLHLNVLGSFEAIRGGERIGPDAWAYAKPKELLAFLALHPGGRTRDQIGAAIWPGASPARVKNSFHVTLHHLRKTLGGADWIIIEDDRYRIAPAVSVALDAERFEREARALLKEEAADPASLRRTLALYRGELLESEVAGAWVEDHRDRLRRLWVDLTLALGRALEGQGDHAAAADVYHAVAAREELNEEAHRRLMLAWSRTGDRVRALRHFDRLLATLRDELEAEPEPETLRVYESLRLAETA